ncbi:hypothetical protein COCC4DRAFT_180253 [Bipolaris maydis ATCC 48331]|uniref:Zn(2)-C6 fungal-type domain-containing protein n=2 Tax=Cochliobolus heterostrophus TaxID=5016 RepID=M2SKH3_COCH5|nr:uncharacterized protein COCC4DRAFT_180253 [Bipolaris maydis ATCC 48331]EMD85815.1 hypothetical protein COCHEDRAFT_1117661 [Bipolaris maydis C5]KAJ5026211.1 hypothetical protein J3E73DRAFT_47548 [Bipolaris maydis]ENH99798.1 hypothetical protein COCC4DRAFT_180253 [Bipolaris maydis ATCC 48331]KAJ5056751.1 hypothetical protein J3E74DRAFT_15258 [Bipolaris maydis]KAJ6196338.1 hypothetical protein J3E72DRAFT_50176 [Bipolaris maydis]
MPKRSTGCFECRKRKVRCDESKPECNTCLKRGTKCPGYRPTQAFILHEFDTKRDKPALIKEDENHYKFAIQSYSRSKQQGKSQSNPGIRVESVQYEPDIPKQVSLVASERIQHVSTFVALYLPRTEGQALPGPSALMLGLPNLPVNSPVLEAAIDALAAAQLAVDKMNSPLIHRSRSLYSTALSQMLQAIQDQETALKDETLLSTYLLSLYEVFVGVTRGHGFFYHTQGLLHLVKQRGPSSFVSRLSMQIYHGIRYNSLSIGILLRKASMLDTPEWMSVTAKAAKVDPYVALMDICVMVPRLLERTDKLSRPDCTQEEIDSLIDDSQKVASDAFAWIADFERHGPRYNKVELESMEGFMDICDDRVFDPVFDFHYFGAGICYLIYWSSMLIMQGNTFKLLRQYRKLEPKQLLMWSRQLNSFADSICRGVPYNYRVNTGYASKFGSLTPLMVARKYYEMVGEKAAVAWCTKVYKRGKVPELYQADENLDKYPLEDVKKTIKDDPRYI